MEILNLGGAPDNNSSAPKAGKKLRVLLGIGALAAVTGIGSTLAANITLNSASSGRVEFGQGLVTTAACDSDGINVAPASTFVNATATPEARFNLSSIVFSGINETTCDGKTFTIKGFGDTNATPVAFVGGVQSVLVKLVGTTFQEVSAQTGVTVADGATGIFTIDFSSLATPVAADAVYKITVESSDTP